MSCEQCKSGRRRLRHLLVALLAEGHALVEDYPGVGKTALARALARSLAASSRACSAPRICLRPTLSAPMSTASASRDSSSGRVAINVAVRSPSLPAVPEAPTACRGAHFTSVTISANAWTAVRHHPPATASAARYVLAERALDVAQFELTATQAPPTPTRLPHPCSAAWARSDRGCCASHGCSLGATPCALAASRCETRIGCRRWLAGRRWGSGRPARGWRASRCSAWGRGSRGQARRARRRWGR